MLYYDFILTCFVLLESHR